MKLEAAQRSTSKRLYQPVFITDVLDTKFIVYHLQRKVYSGCGEVGTMTYTRVFGAVKKTFKWLAYFINWDYKK